MSELLHTSLPVEYELRYGTACRICSLGLHAPFGELARSRLRRTKRCLRLARHVLASLRGTIWPTNLSRS